MVNAAKAKPGDISYASSGTGTPYHMAGELFKAMAGVNILHVPYKGSSQARTDVLGGQVMMMFDAVPTIAEAGVPGYEATIWLGIMAPKGTPAPIVQKLNAEINKVLARPDVKAAWAKQGAGTFSMTPTEFGAYLRKDIEKWANVIKVSGIKVQK